MYFVLESRFVVHLFLFINSAYNKLGDTTTLPIILLFFGLKGIVTNIITKHKNYGDIKKKVVPIKIEPIY